jgi:hypothetical protein
MKRFSDLLLFTLIAASLLLAACSSPTTAPATQTPTQVTQPTQAAPATAAPTNTSAPTATQLPTSTTLPTEANTPTQLSAASATPTMVATLANTPTTVAVSQTALVNENTNCRSGPSADYPLIVTFLTGETAKIVSRTTLNNYLIVGAPTNSLQTCWLWTQYVTVNGDLSSLPVATPPPPLVNFTMDYTRIDTCGNYSLEFKVVNTGQKTLEAYTIVVKDLSANSQQTTSKATFDFMNGCYIEKEIGSLDTGKVGYAYAENFSSMPTGHSFEATITICSHNDMTGVCATQVVRFTP